MVGGRLNRDDAWARETVLTLLPHNEKRVVWGTRHPAYLGTAQICGSMSGLNVTLESVMVRSYSVDVIVL